jgi:hypothetical protein
VVGVVVVVEAVRVAAAVEEEGVAVGHELFASVVVPCQGSFKWDQIFLEAIFLGTVGETFLDALPMLFGD